MSFDKAEMQNGKRFYWLKLRDDFFGELTTIALRRQPDGDEMCIAYMKMMLYSLKSDGCIGYEGVLDTLEGEIAIALGEREEIVVRCVESLIRYGLAKRTEDGGIIMTAVEDLVGSESFSAKRMREMRKRESEESKEQAKPTEAVDEPGMEEQSANEEINAETEASQEVHNVQEMCENVHACDEEKRKKKKENRSQKKEKERGNLPAADCRARPTLAEVSEYCAERGNQVDPERWYNYYTANGFMIGRSKMKDWRACIRSWERNGLDRLAPSPVHPPESYEIATASW